MSENFIDAMIVMGSISLIVIVYGFTMWKAERDDDKSHRKHFPHLYDDKQ